MTGEPLPLPEETPNATLLRDAGRLREVLGLDAAEARSQVERMLIQALGIRRAQLIAHPEHAVAANSDPRYAAMLSRRLAGEPLDYVLGWREFHGLDFEVTPAVLVPRADTELLVDLALERCPSAVEAYIADLGTGSGCVAIAVARARPRLHVLAVDRSEDALRVAARNRHRHGAHNVQLVRGDWLSGVAARSLAAIVSNPPYVREGDEHLPALRHEPRCALVSGVDGLDAWRTIVPQARRCLAPGGWLLMEHGYDQGGACRTLLEAAGFAEVFTARDLPGHERVSGGRALG